MAVFLGVCVAACFGSGDFFGGLASRRVSTITILSITQAFALVGAVVYAVGFSGHASGRDLGFGAVAGGLNVVALGALYHGLATGRMGVVAPVTAVVASVIPVAWGTANGEHPSTLALVGVACAIAAGGLIARERSQAVEVHPGRELALAVSAGVGFGVSFIFYSETSKHAGFWPVLTGRGVALPLALLAVLVVRPRLVARPSLALGRRGRTLAAAAGFLDVSATALLLVAFREGLTSLVAPIAALAPAFTVALAWLVLSEPIARLQMAGLLLALLGLTFIAAG